jgi:hypothetical protein
MEKRSLRIWLKFKGVWFSITDGCGQKSNGPNRPSADGAGRGQDHDMIRSLFLVPGWLISTAALCGLLAGLEAWWNRFDWKPRADWESLLLIAGLVVVIVVIWLLSRITRGIISRLVSLGLCVAVIVLGAGHFQLNPEPVAPQSSFPDVKGRTQASPEWYRAGRMVLLCLPAVFRLRRPRN